MQLKFDAEVHIMYLVLIIFFIYFQQNPLANIKRIDCALLPPSRRALEKKLQRAQYVAVLWNHADTACPDQGLSPTDYDWSIEGSLLQPTWFEGPAFPDSLFAGSDNMAMDTDNGGDSDSTIIDETESQSSEEDINFDLSDFKFSDMSDEDPWSEDSDSDTEGLDQSSQIDKC